MTLNELKPGKSAVVLAVNGEGALRRRLLDMGLTPKTRLFMRKVAPLGDPMEIKLRGYELTLRLEDATKIDIMEIEENI
ncbi:MAG: ferrous iron transport protein A [Clostridia bacterium]|nr:ferrous iron transport protein A [Clostridia bacterium]